MGLMRRSAKSHDRLLLLHSLATNTGKVNRKRNYPSVTILDRGEGQTPEMQPDNASFSGEQPQEGHRVHPW